MEQLCFLVPKGLTPRDVMPRENLTGQGPDVTLALAVINCGASKFKLETTGEQAAEENDRLERTRLWLLSLLEGAS